MAQSILVVEDNPITRKMMAVTLRSAGYDVLTAGDGERALELAATKHPAIVIQDLLLPDMDGIELGRRLRALPGGGDLVLIALSGLASKLEEALNVHPGFAQLLFKPIEPARLLSILDTLHPPTSLSEPLAREVACKTAQLAIMTAVTAVIAQGHNLQSTLTEVLARILDAAGVSIGAIYLTDADGAVQLTCQIGYPVSVSRHLEAFFGQTLLLKAVMDSQQPMSVPADGSGSPTPGDVTPVTDLADGKVRCILLPLVTQGAPYGVLVMSSTRHDVGDHWLEIVQAMGVQIAQAIALARWAIERETALAETEKARMAAEKANAVKAQFLAVMSHELRTPLNAINGYVDLLEMGLRGPMTTGQTEDLKRVRVNAQHLLRLIEEILDHVQLDAGRARMQQHGVSLASALMRAEALVAPQFRTKGLWLSIESCDPARAVEADFARLIQVFVNLLTNALKFTPTGGEVAVTTTTSGARVMIHVSDTGPGIAPEHLDHIFEAFYQVDRSLTRSQTGVGLGLAICREIIRAMGGDICVSSTCGAGSTFTVTLPKADHVEHTRTPSHSWPVIVQERAPTLM